jgi:putative acetyltransferase
MIRLLRTNSEHPDFIDLVSHLDKDLAARDGQDHAYYAQFNKIDMIKHAVVAYDGETALACGAIKELEPGAMEVKRMYTKPGARGKGIATLVLRELENWAKEMGYKRSMLETGKRQPEAIELYKKNNYAVIPNYGQYAGVENSVCFEKSF